MIPLKPNFTAYSIVSNRKRCWNTIGTFGFTQHFVRTFATVYGVGEEWTGALGTGRLDECIIGHFDEEEGLESLSGTLPTKIYEGNVAACSVGWGHTALITTATNDEDSRNCSQILMTGRPHEFSELLRIYRLPKLIRDYAARQTMKSASSGPYADEYSLNPADLVGRFVGMLSDSVTPGVENWEKARGQSAMAVFTPIEPFLDNSNEDGSESNTNGDTNEGIVDVVCSAGFSAFRSNKGSIYSFGLNGYGQCGIGFSSSNVWTPAKVRGLSSENVDYPREYLKQTFPVAKASLGLQRKFLMLREIRS